MKEFNPNSYNNNIDNISGNFDNNSNNYNINNASYNSNSPQNIRKIYEENEKRNRIKIETTEFMSYAVKVELLFQTLHGYLYWISNVEFLFFIVRPILPKMIQKLFSRSQIKRIERIFIVRCIKNVKHLINKIIDIHSHA